MRISAHDQSVLATGQKHHNSSPLTSACNVVVIKDLKRSMMSGTHFVLSV